MKVLMIAQHVNFLPNLDTVIRELCRRARGGVLHGTRLDDAETQARNRRAARRRSRTGLRVARPRSSSHERVPPGASGALARVPPYRTPGAQPWMLFRKGHPLAHRVVAASRGIARGDPAECTRPLWRRALGTQRRSGLALD